MIEGNKGNKRYKFFCLTKTVIGVENFNVGSRSSS